MGAERLAMIPFPSVSIVGFAACTSLGYTLESTLAAMGAGLSNFTDTTVPNEFGHPAVAASLIETGAPRSERMAQLVNHGLADTRPLITQHALRNVPLLIGVPSDLSPREQEAVQTVTQGRDSPIGDTAWFPYGRASTFTALATAMELIRRESHRFVLVVGVDSLCAPAQVYSLVQAGRVLSPLTEGTIPGEAAAFALLARTDDPIVDPAMSVRLEAVAVDRAATPFTRAQVVSGDGLAAVFRTLRTGGSGRVHRVIAAHSGEGYFGRSFAHAYLREVEMMPEPLTVEVLADRVGDVGAAAGILGLAFGAYLMVQDARDDDSRALTYSESDTGEVGAAIIDGAPASWHRASVPPATGSGRE
jgi:3-oxoacyl-[acyl-carrier-protein] synthase I